MTFKQYLSLCKPRIAVTIALTAGTGYIAMAKQVDPLALALLALAMALGSSGAAVFNHVWDRDIDKMMKRTSTRPMVVGGSPQQALILAGVLMTAGLALAASVFNWVVALHLFLGAFFYVVIYTIWLKRRHWMNIVLGGAAGSFAVLAGAAAVDPNEFLLPAVLALVLFLWTPSHFWALAILLAEDYARAGVPMLPVVIGPQRTAWWILANTVALVGSSLLPWTLGLLGPLYAGIAAALGLAFLAFNVKLVMNPSRRWAGWNFAASMPYLLGLFVAIVLDRNL
jgi:protoheme IX farnesyltransferase